MASSPARFPRIARPPHCHAFRIGPAPAWPCLRRRSRRNAKGGFLPHARLQLPSLCARASRCTVDHTPPGAGRWVSGRSRAVRFNSVSRATAPSNRSSLHPPALHALPLQSFARAVCTSLAPIILPDGEALHGLILGHHLARRGTVYTLNVSTPLLVTSSVAALEGHL